MIGVDRFIRYTPRINGSQERNTYYGIPGCYVVIHVPTGKYYIGSTYNIPPRVTNHLTHLKTGRHVSKALQQVYTCREDLCFMIQPCLSKKEAEGVEQSLLNANFGQPDCCNASGYVHPATGNTYALGKRHTNEALIKIGKASIGRVKSPEAIERSREAALRYNQSDVGMRERHRQSIAHGHPIVVDTIYYNSIKSASKILGITMQTLAYRVKSKYFTTYYYANNQNGVQTSKV